MGNTRYSMLPPSLFYFAGGYVETSYGGQAILDARYLILDAGCWMLDASAFAEATADKRCWIAFCEGVFSSL